MFNVSNFAFSKTNETKPVKKEQSSVNENTKGNL